MLNKILLTGFCNTAAEWLLKNMHSCKTLLLPNDKVRDSELLIEAIEKEHFDFVISIGQRPNIKNKVHIETTAAEGGERIVTNFDCDRFAGLLGEMGIASKLSHNAGTSYCNRLYFNGLRYLRENKTDTRMVFLHIPFAKNITDFPGFSRQFAAVIAHMQKNQRADEQEGLYGTD